MPAYRNREPVSRIEKRFAALKAEGRAGLVVYLTAGDPDIETSTRLFEGIAAAGADLIEIGMPFSDPMADGPLIQAAGMRALKGGMTLRKTLAMVKGLRAHDPDTPYVLMGYYNPIYRYGAGAFANDAAAAGVDGLIIVDLPPEEDPELDAPARQAGLDLVRLATPTSDAHRLPKIVDRASGFIYYVAIAGITGTHSAEAGAVYEAVARLRRFTNLPIVVGFGIKTPQQAADIARVADAVVVASALVDRLARNLDPAGKTLPGLIDAVLGDIAALAVGIRGARRTGQ
jgi:tryptophan synthase alpha chain